MALSSNMVEWIILILATSPIWGTLLWEIWDGSVRPMFITSQEVKDQADQLLQQHGPRAMEIAHINEDRARRYCDTFEQAKWRKVGKHLEKRTTAACSILSTGSTSSSNADWTSPHRQACVALQIGNKSEAMKNEAQTEATDSRTDHSRL